MTLNNYIRRCKNCWGPSQKTAQICYWEGEVTSVCSCRCIVARHQTRHYRLTARCDCMKRSTKSKSQTSMAWPLLKGKRPSMIKSQFVQTRIMVWINRSHSTNHRLEKDYELLLGIIRILREMVLDAKHHAIKLQ